jgi:ADP-ribose pyrophosphatase YjhB (NUDIX family)
LATGQSRLAALGNGSWYRSPEAGGAEYVAVCLPAFSLDTVHRDQNMGLSIRNGARIARGASLRVACSAAVFDSGKVLFTRRSDNGQWCLPGGAFETGETVAEACRREVLEETGLTVELTRLIGVYSSPNRISVYPDEVWHVIELVFAARIAKGTLQITEETSEARFFTYEEACALDLVENEWDRIADVYSNAVQAAVR